MKRFLFSILIVLLLIFPVLIFPAHAITIYNCDYLTGGAERSLDFLKVAELNNGDRAIVLYRSGVSDYMYFFKYAASGTTAENTSTHPFYVRAKDYITSGVWYEVSPSWLSLGGTFNIANLIVSDTLTTDKVKALGGLSGGVWYEAATGTSTVSGTTLYGGYIFGKPAGAGATRYVPTATGKGESIVFFNQTNTFNSGGTLFVHFTSGDTIFCNQTITAGTSKFILDGTTPWAKQILCISTATNEWTVKTVGAPTVDWD